MTGFFSSGAVVLVIIAILALELLLLGLWRIKQGRPVGILSLVTTGLPGMFLLLAVRSALTGQDWTWTALWLALSFPAHLADLWRRRP
jgi:hypothetical protein